MRFGSSPKKLESDTSTIFSKSERLVELKVIGARMLITIYLPRYHLYSRPPILPSFNLHHHTHSPLAPGMYIV